MTHTELVNEVLVKLNEIGYSDNVSLISDDGLRLTDYIETAIRDAVMQLDRVNPKEVDVAASGVVVLDEDFVSLLEVNGASWKRAVSTITEKGTPEYVMAMNEFTQPGVNTPMVIRESERSLKLLPATSGSMIYNAAYDGEGITGESESRQVVNVAAEIVLKILENGDR